MTCEFCGGDLDKPARPGCRAPVMHVVGEPYSNPGKGTVLKNDSTTARVAALFDERSRWTSQELNAIVGWQFSQAIFALRKRGWNIVTLRIGPRAYAYQRVSA